MKKFQKIKSLENELKFENKLAHKVGKSSLQTVEQGDNLVVTEKIDGSNAQIRNHCGKLYVYSHKTVLNENRTLNGFYNFAMKYKKELLKLIPEGYSFFGEWLTPHRVEYPTGAYNNWYLFDIFKFDPSKELNNDNHLTDKGQYLGINKVQEFFKDNSNIPDVIPDVPNIYVVPVYNRLDFKDYLANHGEPKKLEDLDGLREYLSDKSLLGARDGHEEGIVVIDLDKKVQIDEQSTGPLRVKCVNEAFKEMRNNKLPLSQGERAALNWANKYITEPRVKKQILELQDNDELPNKITFDWFKNGNAKKISDLTLQDALKESQETPDALTVVSPHYNKNIQKVSKFTNKLVNKVIALTVKNML